MVYYKNVHSNVNTKEIDRMNRKIQVLRGIAIIAVLIIHSCPYSFAGIIIRVNVNFAVALFLFCSGYLTKTSYIDIGKFYKKRLSRVLIPYAIWSLAYTIAFAVRDGTYRSLLNDYIINLIYGTANFSLYFVVVYVLLTLWTPLIGKLAISRFQWIGWLITPLYMLPRTYIPIIFGIRIIPAAITPFFRLQWFQFYYLGIVMGNHLIRYEKSKIHTIFVYVLTLIISLAEGIFWNHAGSYSMATTQARLGCILSSSYACVLAWLYLEDRNKTLSSAWEKMLAWIGDYSFGIYLLHVMVIGVLGRVPGYDSLPFPVNTLLILTITICGLMAMEKFFKSRADRILGIK